MSNKTIYTANDDGPDRPKTIGDFFDMATKSGANGTTYFGYGRVGDDEAQRIKNDTGLDVSGAFRFINE